MLELVKSPDPILKKELNRIFDPPHQDTIDEMVTVMNKCKGVGLCANQVGIDEAFFIAKLSKGLTVCCNPVIARHGKEEIESLEGCLSIVGEDDKPIFKPRKRWAIIDVVYTDMGGALISDTLRRLDAKIFQHEMDHIMGRTCHDGNVGSKA